MGKVVSHLVGVNSPDRPIPSKETQIDKNFNSLIATGSVTRFVKISLLWNNVKKACHFERVHLVFGKKSAYLDNFICYWANFHCCKLPNIKQIIYFLVTMVTGHKMYKVDQLNPNS